MRPSLNAVLLGLALAAMPIPAALCIAAAAEGPAALPPSVKIKPVMIPVMSGDRIEKYTQFEVMLEIGNATQLGEVQVKIPKLQDAIMAAIYRGVGEGWIVRGNIANLPALRREIDESNTRLVGKDVITRIMITPMVRQSSLP